MSLYEFEASGKAKIPTPDEYTQIDQESSIIVLSKGTQYDGTPYFAYIAVKPSKYAEFISMAEENKPCILYNYGEVILFDSLSEPPEIYVKYMREAYGFDDNFHEKLVDEFKKDQKKFISKKEEKRAMEIVAMMKMQQSLGNA